MWDPPAGGKFLLCFFFLTSRAGALVMGFCSCTLLKLFCISLCILIPFCEAQLVIWGRRIQSRILLLKPYWLLASISSSQTKKHTCAVQSCLTNAQPKWTEVTVSKEACGGGLFSLLKLIAGMGSKSGSSCEWGGVCSGGSEMDIQDRVIAVRFVRWHEECGKRRFSEV